MAFENALQSKDTALVASIVWVFLEFWGYSTGPRVNTATWCQAKYYVEVSRASTPWTLFRFLSPSYLSRSTNKRIAWFLHSFKEEAR